MLNNFIGGGQVFLHKVRMFKQVAGSTFKLALLIGICMTVFFRLPEFKALDTAASMSYIRAHMAIKFHEIIPSYSGNRKAPTINAYTSRGLFKNNVPAKAIITSNKFKASYSNMVDFFLSSLVLLLFIAIGSVVLVFGLWSRFGKSVRSDKKKEGSGVILTPEQVARTLKSLRMNSDFVIGKMPLVKGMETMNFLVSGSVGSGKTNLMHNLIPQILKKNQPAVIIDNTGEMIAKYYNKERGDIIFNPFDDRSHTWDFWKDSSRLTDLENFANILIGFNSRKNHREASDFWEEAAQSVFVAFASTIRDRRNYSVEKLYNMLCCLDNTELHQILKGTAAAKHFSKDNEKVVASIMSVLISNIKPLRFIRGKSKNGSFSIEDYLNKTNAGGNGILFLACDPSARKLSAPLNAALLELLTSRMRRTRTSDVNKLWIVMDELPSLGKLPSLGELMAEGRKYGTCVLAGLQSTSQLYKHYGDADSSNLIGLFKTKFMFASDDPRMGDLYSKLCGNATIISQQKNTSFGANEFRDGVSYNERKETTPLVSYEEFGQLNTGECYTLLPLASVRLSKMQVPQAKIEDKNSRFVESAEGMQNISLERRVERDDEEDELAIENINESMDVPQKTKPPKTKEIQNDTDKQKQEGALPADDPHGTNAHSDIKNGPRPELITEFAKDEI